MSNTINTIETRGNEGGNTKPLRSRKWCFTLNNYTMDEKKKIEDYCKTQKHYILGEEIGDQGTPHLQGYLEGNNPIANTTLKNVCVRWHIEPARGSTEDNLKYCSKEGNYKTNIKELKIIKELRPWQQNIVNILKTEPDDRTIHWVIDKIGNMGKTALCKYLVYHYNAAYVSGKANDIKYIISEMKDKPEIVLLDYPRSLEGYVSYQAIEEIKNGIFCSGKYESKTVLMNSPHIVVFSNFEPKQEMLSEDRWNIIHIHSGNSSDPDN